MKKLLILILGTMILTPLLSAESFEFWVGNITMARAYFDIFNGINALMQNSTYLEVLKLTFSLGAFFIFIAGIFKIMQGGDSKAAIFDTTKYLIAGSMLMLFILPNPNKPQNNADLLVQAKEIPYSYCSDKSIVNGRVVDYSTYSAYSVSLTAPLAWFFSAVNSIGYNLTDMASAVYSNVSNDSTVGNSLAAMSRNGFGKTIEGAKAAASFTFDQLSLDFLKSTINTSFGELTNGYILSRGIKHFYNDCIFGYSSVDPSVTADIISAVQKTGSLEMTLLDLFNNNEIKIYKNLKDSNASLITTISDTVKPGDLTISENNTYGTCKEYYNNVLFQALSGITSDDLFCASQYATSINPGSMYLMTGDSQYTSAPVATQFMVQNGIQNVTQNAINSSPLKNQMGFASGTSQAGFILNSTGTGAYMAKMLPYLQMGIRAVLYAFFPFVFVVILLPGGFSVAKSYAQSVIWVELWSPVAAILNMFLSYFQLNDLSGVFQNDGYNSLSAIHIASDANMLASVGGYLYASVPALTYLILKGSAQMLGSITGGMASGFSKNFSDQTINQQMALKTESEKMTEASGKFVSMAEAAQKGVQAQAIAQGTMLGDLSRDGKFEENLTNKGHSDAYTTLGEVARGEEYASNRKGYQNTTQTTNKKQMREEMQTFKDANVFNPDGTVNQKNLNDIVAGKSVANASEMVAHSDFLKSLKKKHNFTDQEAVQYGAKLISGNKLGSQEKDIETARAYLMLNDKEHAEEIAAMSNMQIADRFADYVTDRSSTDGAVNAKQLALSKELLKKFHQNVSITSKTTEKSLAKEIGNGAIVKKHIDKDGKAVFTAVDKNGREYYGKEGFTLKSTDRDMSQQTLKSEEIKEREENMNEHAEDLNYTDFNGSVLRNGLTQQQANNAANEAEAKFHEDQTFFRNMSANIAGLLRGEKGLADLSSFKGSAKKMKNVFELLAKNAKSKGDTANAKKYQSIANGVLDKNGNVNAKGLMRAAKELGGLEEVPKGINAQQQIDNAKTMLENDFNTGAKAINTTAADKKQQIQMKQDSTTVHNLMKENVSIPTMSKDGKSLKEISTREVYDKYRNSLMQKKREQLGLKEGEKLTKDQLDNIDLQASSNTMAEMNSYAQNFDKVANFIKTKQYDKSGEGAINWGNKMAITNMATFAKIKDIGYLSNEIYNAAAKKFDTVKNMTKEDFEGQILGGIQGYQLAKGLGKDFSTLFNKLRGAKGKEQAKQRDMLVNQIVDTLGDKGIISNLKKPGTVTRL